MGHPHYQRNASNTGWVHVSDDNWNAPRLSKALLYAPVGTSKSSRSTLEDAVHTKQRDRVTATSLDTDLHALLDHVQDRLYSGVMEAWLSKDGYDAWPDFEKLKQDAAIESNPAKKKTLEDAYKKAIAQTAPDLVATIDDPVEEWARVVVERFIFSAYGGSGVNQGGTDEDLYKRFPDVHPVIMACQQLSSMVIMSRGVPWTHLSTPSQQPDPDDKSKKVKVARTEDQTKGHAVGCGCTSGTVNYFAFDDGFHEIFRKGTKYGNVDDLLNLPSASIKRITPGSVVVFNAGGETSTSQDAVGGTTHIASVLRVEGARVQFLDTGVVVGNLESAGADGGTADHSFLYKPTGNIPHSSDLVAIGVLSEKDPATLGAQATKLAASRPLGLVRLIILDTGNAAAPVRFVSKLLHMRFPVSYLIWSLRGLPVKGLAVLWYVYGSSGGWTDILAAGPPTQPASQVLTGSGSLVAVNVLRGNDDGTVSAYRRKVAKSEDKAYAAANPGKSRWIDVDGWYNGLNAYSGMPPAATPEMALDAQMKLPDGSTMGLAKWCASRSTFGNRFLHKANEAKGTVDDGTVGILDS